MHLKKIIHFLTIFSGSKWIYSFKLLWFPLTVDVIFPASHTQTDFNWAVYSLTVNYTHFWVKSVGLNFDDFFIPP